MENNRDISERSAGDNLSFGIVIIGLLCGVAGVLLTTPGIAVTGGVLIAFGLSYFGLKQLLAR